MDRQKTGARLAALLVVAGCVGAQQVASQLPGGLDDIIDQQIVEDVVEDVAETVEEAVEDTVEQQVESDVVEQIEEDVTVAIEQQLETEIADAVQQQIESGVVEQIQEDVTGVVEQVVESEIVEAVQEQIESGVVGAITTQVENSVVGEIGDKVLGAVESEIESVVGELEDVVGELDDVVGEIGDVPAGLLDTAGNVAETAEEVVNTAGGVAGGAAGDGAAGAGTESAPRETFTAGVDPLGRAIEGDVWVVLVPSEFAERIADWGFTIRERRDLTALERVLLLVAAPVDRDIAQAALELALDAPGTEVDFNHVYRPSAEPEDETLTAAPASPTGGTTTRALSPLSIGIVDSAVAVEHEALQNADIVQRDFVPFGNERPTAHGTAVASILVGDTARLRPQLRGWRVYAASVFFADAEGDAAATVDSLTGAGEWLAAEGVPVINMSLAGPQNRVLDAAIAALVERGVVVVAAVGNNGPTGAPLYPAASANVVGVTAIDDANRVYRYANRGPHVRFAAPGVDIRVAKSGGGYRGLEGTSFAAPYAAAVVAKTLASRIGATPAAVLAELERTAVDLGARAFDSVFGFGLISEPPTPVTALR